MFPDKSQLPTDGVEQYSADSLIRSGFVPMFSSEDENLSHLVWAFQAVVASGL
jgi:hypothetical protein